MTHTSIHTFIHVYLAYTSNYNFKYVYLWPSPQQLTFSGFKSLHMFMPAFIKEQNNNKKHSTVDIHYLYFNTRNVAKYLRLRNYSIIIVICMWMNAKPCWQYAQKGVYIHTMYVYRYILSIETLSTVYSNDMSIAQHWCTSDNQMSKVRCNKYEQVYLYECMSMCVSVYMQACRKCEW